MERAIANHPSVKKAEEAAAANARSSAMSQLQAMNGAPAQAVMRVTSGQDWLLKRALDIGVQSLLVPLIDTAEEAAEMARADGRADLLVHEARATLPARSFPNGAHVAEVEVDPDTGEITLDRYTVVDDFGNLINPMLAEGQVHGGVAQGVGQALMEHVVHDEEGQLLTASFMDYAMPRAADLPMISFTSEPVPSTANAMGMKGCGEAGTVGALAAVSNAVQDAFRPFGNRHTNMPHDHWRIWKTANDLGMHD